MSKYPSGKRKKVIPKKTGIRREIDQDPNTFVLRLLLNAAPYYISGSIIAQQLKMSRVAVWSRIDKLRKAGLTIEASQNLGYRLAAEPNNFNASLIRAWFDQIGNNCNIFVYDNTDSTNDEAERLLANGANAPFAVLANNQTHGRGRRGRKWFSPGGGNLYLSLGFRPDVQALKLRNFTLWQGINICKFLRDFTGSDKIKVKWPNDIYYEDKKIAGMLTEASIDCERIKTLIFGIGLNINAPAKNYPKKLKRSLMTIQTLMGNQIRLHELSAMIIKIAMKSYIQTKSGESENLLIDQWQGLDAFYGKKVKVTTSNETVLGRAEGINIEGHFKVKLRNGRFKYFASVEDLEKI